MITILLSKPNESAHQMETIKHIFGFFQDWPESPFESELTNTELMKYFPLVQTLKVLIMNSLIGSISLVRIDVTNVIWKNRVKFSYIRNWFGWR